MARKRMIHPGIWTDEKFLTLKNNEARLLFIGMMNFANDEGIFKYKPISLKAQVLPLSSSKLPIIEDYIRTMLELKLLEKGHDIDGTKLLRYTNWHTYQKINHATPSKYTFTKEEIKDSINTNVEVSEDSSKTTSQYNINKSNIIKDNTIKSNTSSKKNQDFTFEQFYDLYPKKQAKEKAQKSFKKLKKAEIKALKVGLDSWVAYWEESSTDAQFIPLPATWINQKRWNDDIPTVEADKPNKFKSDLDKEIFNRHNNQIEQDKRMKAYMEEATKNASDEIPDLLEGLKKHKEDNEKPLKGLIGQVVAKSKANTSADG
tara:strand:- start:2108 stop:3058 length:951 start_codon:yes stop_codon:yes gene_type:complete